MAWRLVSNTIWLALVFLALLALLLVGGIAVQGFGTSQAFRSLGMTFLPLGLLAPLMVLLMRRGGLDLSVGAVGALAAVVAAGALSRGMAPMWAVLLGLVVALAAGLVNVLLVGVAGVHAAPATLGTMMLARAVAGLLAENRAQMLPESFGGFGGGLATAGWVMLVLGALAAEALAQLTPFGRRSMGPEGTGESVLRRMAFSGLPYLAMSFLAGLAGLILMARLTVVTPTAGLGWEIDVLAAAVLGGTLMSRPVGSAIGALLGALIVVSVRHLFLMTNLAETASQAASGLVLLLSLAVCAGFYGLVGLIHGVRRRSLS